MRERIARLISNIINPFLMSAAVIALLSFRGAPSASDALKWMAIALVVSVLPVFIIVACMVRRRKIKGFFDNTQGQRRSIYLLSGALGAISCGLLWGLQAPELLKVTFTAGIIEILIFTGINHYWKISLHSAVAAGMVTILTLVYGPVALWTFIFFPLVAWSRIALQQHSLAQVISGGALAAGIAAVVFAGFGMIVV
jgi:membrane-associated phospholipid phosphatase